MRWFARRLRWRRRELTCARRERRARTSGDDASKYKGHQLTDARYLMAMPARLSVFRTCVRWLVKGREGEEGRVRTRREERCELVCGTPSLLLSLPSHLVLDESRVPEVPAGGALARGGRRAVGLARPAEPAARRRHESWSSSGLGGGVRPLDSSSFTPAALAQPSLGPARADQWRQVSAAGSKEGRGAAGRGPGGRARGDRGLLLAFGGRRRTTSNPPALRSRRLWEERREARARNNEDDSME